MLTIFLGMEMAMSRPGEVIDVDSAIIFLGKAAKYFENRPTGGEDRAYWANVYNAENCRKVQALVVALDNKARGST